MTLDRSQRRGLRAQLERQLRAAIESGRLPSGSSLPATRVLAHELGVARSVIVDAYAQLAAEGYLEARQGSGTWVRAASVAERRHTAARSGVEIHFRSGFAEPASFPRRKWLRHYREALASMPDVLFGYPEAQGVLTLRRSLAGYLGRVRGVQTTPEQLVVCGGFSQGIVLVCRALRARGVDRMGVEDPCFSYHRRLIAAAGLEPVPIAVDEQGVDVAQLRKSRVPAVALAPAHSYPVGAVLSPDRTVELLAWARDTDALIVEDDYDAEFRYDRAPIGALQRHLPEQIVYGGTASKMLSPALRMGWLAVPSSLRHEVTRQKFFDDMATDTLGQLALAGLIDEGDLARHLRRVRPMYRRRRDAVVRALARSLPEARIIGVAAGLHVYVELPPHCDEQALIEAGRRFGVEVEGARRHWWDREDAPPALVIGYGTVAEAAIERGIAALGTAYSSLYTASVAQPA